MEPAIIAVAGREVPISNPDKVLFPEAGHTKLDLARYYLAVAEGALRGAGGRPNVLVRYPNGIKERVLLPEAGAGLASALDRDRVAQVSLRAASAEEVVPREPAALAWLANLACLELHPHPVRADDLDHPDELRVDLDPVPGRRVGPGAPGGAGGPGRARRAGAHRLAQDLRLPRHPYHRADRAALELRPGAPSRPGAGPRGRAARARPGDQQVVEGRAPRRLRRLQPERQGPHRRLGLFGAAHAGRPGLGAARRGTRCRTVDPAEFTLATMPERFAELGDRHAGIDAAAGSLEPLLELSAEQERGGLGDAPWPPHYRKQAGEPARVQPSKARAARHPLITIGHAETKGGCAGGTGAVEGETPGRGAAPGGGGRAGGFDPGPLIHLDPDPDQSAARAGRAPAGSGAARSRTRRPCAARRAA